MWRTDLRVVSLMPLLPEIEYPIADVPQAQKAIRKAYQARLKKAKQKRDREKEQAEKKQAASSSTQVAPPATLAKPASSSRAGPDVKKSKVCTCL